MKARPPVVCRLACVLIVAVWAALPVSAQSAAGTARPLIALYEPAGQKADSTLTAALGTVADSVELDLACLQRFDVRRLPAVDPAKDMAGVRSYCQANRIDQAILGSGSARPSGGYAFRLVLYDRRSDSVTMVQDGACSGALDMFDATDTLVAALLDKLNGAHLLFGSLTVQTQPPGALVSLNGKEVGPSPLSLRGLPVGAVNITVRSPGWEDGSATATVQDNQVTDAALTLARSQGTLTLDMPRDATVKLRAAGIPERTLRGPASEQLPTGSYELEAACPGLSTVRQSLSVARNTTASFRPWAGAYLEVGTTVEGAAVTVDGVPKGTVPLLMEVDPGVLHRVELRKDKYQVYAADLSVAAARKVSFSPEMTLRTGSVRVEITPAGASVQLDDGPAMDAPCTFENVPPGPHVINARNNMVAWRWYVVPLRTSVNVDPDEQTVVGLPSQPGTGRMELTGLPPQAQVTVEGTVWQPGRLVPAGVLDVAVSLPSGQQWKGTVPVGPGAYASVSLDTLRAAIPFRKITVDGKVDDWEGLEPLWKGIREKGDNYWFLRGIRDPFPGQPGTVLAGAYLCRDESNIYLRMDFDNGTPSLTLTSVVTYNLVREIHFLLSDGKTLIANVGCSRTWGISSWVGLWDNAARASTDLGTLNAYAMAGSTLEFAIPLSRFQKYLSAGPVSAQVCVADAGPDNWVNGYNSYSRLVELAK